MFFPSQNTYTCSNTQVHYEIYDGTPLLRKWITATQAPGSPPVVVDDVTIEMLRAPNFAPEQMTVIQIAANNPVQKGVVRKEGEKKEITRWGEEGKKNTCMKGEKKRCKRWKNYLQ